MTPEEVLQLIPQQPPFRFVDALDSIDESSVVGRYTFREDEWFYRGHFPGFPITPAVITTESMAQIGIVALGIFLIATEKGPEEARRRLALLTETDLQFERIVRPGQTIVVIGELVFWRRGKLKTRVSASLDDGTLIATGTIGGMGAPVDAV